MAHMGVKCPEGPRKEAVFKSVYSVFKAFVPSSRGQLAEQVVSGMVMVMDDFLCSGEASRAGRGQPIVFSADLITHHQKPGTRCS